jgi:hypothetical protein
MILPMQTKTYYSYPLSNNGIRSFYRYYSNNDNHLHDQQQHLKYSISLSDPNYLQSQGSNSHTIIETETKVSLKPHLSNEFFLWMTILMLH